MDMMYYIVFSGVYIILFQLALCLKDEMGFDFMLMVGTFVLGGVIGWYFNAYDTGFVVAMVMSFLYL
jgi:hypothetical protein